MIEEIAIILVEYLVIMLVIILIMIIFLQESISMINRNTIVKQQLSSNHDNTIYDDDRQKGGEYCV